MKAKKYLMAFTAIAALSSCSQSEEFALDNGQSSYDKNAVTFGTYLGQSPKTRATVTDIDIMKGDAYPGFGVFAYNTGADNFADVSAATSDFMYNVPVKWNGSEWTYTDVKQWPEAGKVSFFAYAPYTETPGTANITAIPNQTATGAPVISFTVAEKVGDQIDLLYADAKTDQTKETNGGKVQFSFNHALSRVGFKAKLEGEAGSKGSVTINSITFKSLALNTSGKFNLHTGEWTERVTGAMEYTFTTDNFETGSNVLTLPDAETTSNSVVLTGDGNYLMVIPNETKGLINITVNYTETLENGTQRPVTFTTPFEFAFEKGKAYSLVLSINLTSESETSADVSFTADVNPWDNLNPDGSGSDVSIDYNVATLTMYAACPSITTTEYLYAGFTDDNSYLKIINVLCGEDEEEVSYVLPENLFALKTGGNVIDNDFFYDWNNDFKLAAWCSREIGTVVNDNKIWELDESIVRGMYKDDVVAYYDKDEAHRTITLRKGQNTKLYPLLWEITVN